MANVVATNPNPPRVTPTASMPVRVPWGHWFAQAIAHEAKLIEAAAAGGVTLALHQVPFGSIVSGFIAPQVIEQMVDKGLKALEGVVDPMALTVDSANTLLATIANIVNNEEPALAGWVGDQLEPMIKAALGKLGISL